MTNLLNKSLISAISFLLVMAFSPMTLAAENPFGMSDVDTGSITVAEKGKCGEGKCGEGKCGKAKKDGKCGDDKKDGKAKKDGKCGEGKKDGKKGKCGEGKCGGM